MILLTFLQIYFTFIGCSLDSEDYDKQLSDWLSSTYSNSPTSIDDDLNDIIKNVFGGNDEESFTTKDDSENSKTDFSEQQFIIDDHTYSRPNKKRKMDNHSTEIQKEIEFGIICNSLGENIKADDLTEEEKELLTLQFPDLGRMNYNFDFDEMMLIVIKKMNLILINLMNILNPHRNYDIYKKDSSDYAKLKNVYKHLVETFINRKLSIRNRLKEFRKTGFFKYFINNLNKDLKTFDFKCNSKNDLLNKFIKGDTDAFRREFYMLCIFDTLEKLKMQRNQLGLFPGLLLISFSVENKTDLYTNLLYLHAYLRCTILLQKGGFSPNIETYIQKNREMTVEKLLSEHGISLEKLNNFNNYVRNKYSSIREPITDTKDLFHNFFHFMVTCDKQIFSEQSKAIKKKNKSMVHIDSVYFKLYKDLEELFFMITIN